MGAILCKTNKEQRAERPTCIPRETYTQLAKNQLQRLEPGLQHTPRILMLQKAKYI